MVYFCAESGEVRRSSRGGDVRRWGRQDIGGGVEAGIRSRLLQLLCVMTDQHLCPLLLISWTHTLKEVRLSEDLGF